MGGMHFAVMDERDDFLFVMMKMAKIWYYDHW